MTNVPENPGTPDKKNKERVKKDLLKEMKSSWKKGRRQLKRKINQLEASYRDTPYRFYLNQVEKTLLAPGDQTWEEVKTKIDKIETSGKSDRDKITELGNLKEEMQKEIDAEAKNAIALLEKMTKTEYDMVTRKALAKLEVYAPMLKEMAQSKKGAPLTKMFAEFVELTSLGNMKQGTSKEYVETLEKGILDSETAPIAFFVLTMATQKVRDEFTRNFIDNHPDKAVWMLELGSRYGCFTANRMREHFEYCKKKCPEAQKELDNFEENKIVFDTRYNAMSKIKQRVSDLHVRDGRNPALKMLTFGQMARFIGYMASILTMGANLLANRKMIKENPLAIVKNPYILGSAGIWAYLHKTGKGERLKDMFAGKSTRKERKKMNGLSRLKEYADTSDRWSSFLNNGGVEVMVKYDFHLRNQKTVSGIMAYAPDFLEFCGKNEKQKGTARKPSEIFAGMMESNKDKTQKELEDFIYVMRELKIENKKNFTDAMEEANQKLS